MERDGGEIQLRDQDGNFNSHAHVERDIVWAVMQSLEPISTHTLTWSVTHKNRLAFEVIVISTHTLTWSVTTSVQPVCKHGYISTHTLTWSVTGFRLRS